MRTACRYAFKRKVTCSTVEFFKEHRKTNRTEKYKEVFYARVCVIVQVVGAFSVGIVSLVHYCYYCYTKRVFVQIFVG